MKFLAWHHAALVAVLSAAKLSSTEAFVPASISAGKSSISAAESAAPPRLVGILRDAKPPAEAASSDERSTSNTASNAVLEDPLFREADAIFEAIDANGDGGITNDELREHLEDKGYPSESIRMLFTAVDKNADGIISREEMRYAFSTYEVSALYRAFGLGCYIGDNFHRESEAELQEADEDDEDQNFDDAVSAIRSKALSNRSCSPEMLTKLADMIFDMIDVDGSGEIDVLELRMHFADNDQTCTTTCFRQVNTASIASVDNVLKALDINADGVISREEMRSGFQQYDPRALSSALGLQVSRTAET